MTSFDLLWQGFGVAASPSGILAVFIGVLIGQVVGALPGIGPAAGMALLLPVPFGMPPCAAVMMLAGIVCGGMYGGTITSVLINVPGESSSVMTAVDGHQLARRGRAGAALSIAAIGSFIAGVGGTVALAFAAVALSTIALRFNAPEFFLLALLGLTSSARLCGGSPAEFLMLAVLVLILELLVSYPLP